MCCFACRSDASTNARNAGPIAARPTFGSNDDGNNCVRTAVLNWLMGMKKASSTSDAWNYACLTALVKNSDNDALLLYVGNNPPIDVVLMLLRTPFQLIIELLIFK